MKVYDVRGESGGNWDLIWGHLCLSSSLVLQKLNLGNLEITGEKSVLCSRDLSQGQAKNQTSTQGLGCLRMVHSRSHIGEGVGNTRCSWSDICGVELSCLGILMWR